MGTKRIDEATRMSGKTGYYEVYEGYQEDADGIAQLAALTRRARRRVEAALAAEALTMGAIGLAVGVAVGAALAWKLATQRR